MAGSRRHIRPDGRQRHIVDATIRAHAEFRGWSILALNVRTNHVHVVVRAPDETPETVMGQFKSWSTRKLREVGHLEHTQEVWTRHGSTKYLWEDRGLPQAIDYVTNGQ